MIFADVINIDHLSIKIAKNVDFDLVAKLYSVIKSGNNVFCLG